MIASPRQRHYGVLWVVVDEDEIDFLFTLPSSGLIEKKKTYLGMRTIFGSEPVMVAYLGIDLGPLF